MTIGDSEVGEGGDILNRSRFKWKMLSLSGPKASLFLQLWIALVTMSAVNVSAISIGFLLLSRVTNRVSLEEECLLSFEVLNCLLTWRLAVWTMRTRFR